MIVCSAEMIFSVKSAESDCGASTFSWSTFTSPSGSSFSGFAGLSESRRKAKPPAMNSVSVRPLKTSSSFHVGLIVL